MLRPALLAILACVAAPACASVRTVACDAQVVSVKRGLCANALSAEDFAAIAGGVSWWYNWHFAVGDSAPKESSVTHVPMVWGSHPDSLDGLKGNLAKGGKTRFVFALNEPNLKGQAFMSPKEAAESYRAIEKVAAAHGVAVVGPHMAIGSPEEGSITAFDPVEEREMTYTYMMPYLNAFYHYAGEAKIERVGVHSYGNVGELGWLVGMLAKEKKRIWVTEFAWWDAPDDDALVDYLVKAVDLLERSPAVEGYAWFKERAKGGKISLLAGKPGELTDLGSTYIRMPVHDPDLYYRVPGRLEAERYVSGHGQDVRCTTDEDGFLDVTTGEDGGWLEYNLDVAESGKHELSVRCQAEAGAEFVVRRGKKRLALLKVPAGGIGWSTLAVRIRLNAGRQTLRLQLPGVSALNWLSLQSL